MKLSDLFIVRDGMAVLHSPEDAALREAQQEVLLGRKDLRAKIRQLFANGMVFTFIGQDECKVYREKLGMI